MVAVRDEITSWVKAYTPELYAYAVSKTSDVTTAEDIVQNTFLSAFEAYSTFENRSHPRTWLFSILKNKIADHYRNRYKQVENSYIDDATDVLFDKNGRLKAPCSSIKWSTDEELLDNKDFINALNGCIDALPNKMSAVVELKYLNNSDSQAVCRKLDITPANFWQIMHRAKLLLKTCLENKWFKTENVH
jgi:RNA polymerase sigma-70 factor (ECF subfamily)